MREQVQQIPGELSARLRALRSQYPTLAITTEIIHHTDRLIAFRATIMIEGLIRAQGHAAQPAEPTGAFVTATEQLAVEQALLLGGFDLPHDDGRAEMSASQERPAPQTAPLAAPPATDTPPVRKNKAVAKPPTPPTPPTTDDLAAPLVADVQPSLPALVPSTAEEAESAGVDAKSGEQEAAPPIAPQPKRHRQAARTRAKAQATSATPAAETETNTVIPAAPPIITDEAISAETHTDVAEPATAPDTAPVVETTVDEVVSIHPTPVPLASEAPDEALTPAPLANETLLEVPAPAPVSAPETDAIMVPPTPPAPRRSRTRSATATSAVAATPAVTVAADTPPTREALRAAWQVGRPIPAWWPQGRPLVAQPIGKTRVGRLRTLALDEEISTSLLDTYSTLLFGVPVAGLDQTQSLILEERLNPAYPSPLEELRVRRILHPLAVSDEMAITEGQPFLVRWSDVPPVEEEPEPVAPPTLTWRERGKKGSARRR